MSEKCNWGISCAYIVLGLGFFALIAGTTNIIFISETKERVRALEVKIQYLEAKFDRLEDWNSRIEA